MMLLAVLLQIDDPYAGLLRDRGIATDARGVVEYLSRLAPTDENRARAADLVRSLGDEDFNARESANTQLRQLLPTLRALAGEAIDAATTSNDLEIQSRVRRLLREASAADAKFLLRAALLTAARLKAAGTVAAVLPLYDLIDDAGLRRAMRIAVRDAATKEDEPRLRAAGSPPAVVALGRLGADVAPLLKDPSAAVRLAAARALIDRGDPAGLEPLGELLSAEDADVARESASTLHLATGKYHASPKEWLAWIRAEGAGAALKFPIPDRAPELGRTLIALYSAGKVVELDRAGNVVFEKEGVGGAFAVHGLPNGHRLVGGYSSRAVIEYDAEGNEVWKKDGLPNGPLAVRRIENGNTLVACGDSGKILEVAPDGSIAREVTIDGRPSDVSMLENGNLLVALYNGNKVVEVDRSDRVVWSIEGLSQPFGVQRLENGNTLVCELGAQRVVEYDRSGARVWAKEGVNQPYDAVRLESGNTLISEFGAGVIEVDPAGETVWSHKVNGVGRVSRY